MAPVVRILAAFLRRRAHGNPLPVRSSCSMADPNKAIGQGNRQAAIIAPPIRLNTDGGEEFYSRIRNLSRFLASLIQFGARPHAGPGRAGAGSRYFGGGTPCESLGRPRRLPKISRLSKLDHPRPDISENGVVLLLPDGGRLAFEPGKLRFQFLVCRHGQSPTRQYQMAVIVSFV
jgi:hypothetical protein